MTLHPWGCGAVPATLCLCWRRSVVSFGSPFWHHWGSWCGFSPSLFPAAVKRWALGSVMRWTRFLGAVNLACPGGAAPGGAVPPGAVVAQGRVWHLLVPWHNCSSSPSFLIAPRACLPLPCLDSSIARFLESSLLLFEWCLTCSILTPAWGIWCVTRAEIVKILRWYQNKT